MRTLLLLDVETTGTDPAKDRVVEIGAVRWDIDCRAIVSTHSTLVRSETNDAERVNGISVPLLAAHGRSMTEATAWARRAAAGCESIVAYNADFDASFLSDVSAQWVDAMAFRWPRFSHSQSLVNVALAHGVGVTGAHRAVADCLLLAALVERACEMGMSIEEEVARGLRPRELVASCHPYEDGNHTNKAAGFRWDDGRRAWVRKMAAEDIAALPFAVRRLE